MTSMTNMDEVKSSLKLKAIITAVCFFFGISLLVGLFLFSRNPDYEDATIRSQEILLKKLSVFALWLTLASIAVGVLSVITIVGPIFVLWIWGVTIGILAAVQAIFAVLLAVKLS